MTKKQLFKLAAESGKHRTVIRPSYLAIVKGNVQVNFWEDGSISRGDVPLDLAIRMTITDAAKALGLK